MILTVVTGSHVALDSSVTSAKVVICVYSLVFWETWHVVASYYQGCLGSCFDDPS